MANKVASWKFFDGKLTHPSTSTVQKCPTYTEILLLNNLDIVKDVIEWPSGRAYGRLVLEDYYKEPSEYPKYYITIVNTEDFKSPISACIPFYVDVKITKILSSMMSIVGESPIVTEGYTDTGYTLSSDELRQVSSTMSGNTNTFRVYVPVSFTTLTLTFKCKNALSVYSSIEVKGVNPEGVVSSFLNNTDEDVTIKYGATSTTISPGYSYTETLPSNASPQFTLSFKSSGKKIGLRKFKNTVETTSTSEVSTSISGTSGKVTINTSSEVDIYKLYVFTIR